MQPASPEDKLRKWYLLAGAGRSRFSSLWAPVCGARYSSRLQQQFSVGGRALFL